MCIIFIELSNFNQLENCSFQVHVYFENCSYKKYLVAFSASAFRNKQWKLHSEYLLLVLQGPSLSGEFLLLFLLFMDLFSHVPVLSTLLLLILNFARLFAVCLSLPFCFNPFLRSEMIFHSEALLTTSADVVLLRYFMW